MTNNRTTITLKGFSTRTSLQRLDDFVEVDQPLPAAPRANPNAPASADSVRAPLDISSRLENWARWCTSSDGGTAAACMTGAICESMRRAQAGVLSGGSVISTTINSADAILVGRAMIRIDFNHRRLLGLFYVDQERSSFIAALLRFQSREFDRRMVEAKAALEAVLASLQCLYF